MGTAKNPNAGTLSCNVPVQPILAFLVIFTASFSKACIFTIFCNLQLESTAVHWPVHAESHHTVVKLFFFKKRSRSSTRGRRFPSPRQQRSDPSSQKARTPRPGSLQQSRRQRKPWQHSWPPPSCPGLSPSSSCCSAPPSPSTVSARDASHPSVLRRHAVSPAEGWSYGELS